MQFKAEVSDSPHVRVVQLAGRVQGGISTELVRLYDESEKPVRLDLRDLVSLDAVGLSTLVTLERRGGELVNASPFVALQLDGERAKRTGKLRGSPRRSKPERPVRGRKSSTHTRSEER